MQTVNVVFRPKKNDKANGNLHLRITENRKSKFKSLGIDLPLKHWDNDNQRVLPSFKGVYKILNEKIENTLNELDEVNQNLKALNSGNSVICEYWKKHNQNTINANTKASRGANLIKFECFLNDAKLQGLKFHQLTPHIVGMYNNYLIKELNQRSVSTYMGYFKSVINKAIKEQIVNYRLYPFLNYQRKPYINKKARALTVEQVKLLINTKFPETQSYYRDMFIFQIMGGGLRVRDLITLKWQNIEVNDKGIYLHYHQIKTGREIKTKLSYKALAPLTPIFNNLYPNKTKSITNTIKWLNSQLALKEKWQSSNKYREFDAKKIEGYEHYDYKEKRSYQFDEVQKTTLEKITLDQNIMMYMEDLQLEYTELLTSIIKDKGQDYIFNLMDGIELKHTNSDPSINIKTQGKISVYNYHLKKICKQLDIPKFTSHTARHSFAQVLVNSNTNLFYIQQFLGHSSMGVTQNYVRSLDNNQLDEVSDTLANHF